MTGARGRIDFQNVFRHKRAALLVGALMALGVAMDGGVAFGQSAPPPSRQHTLAEVERFVARGQYGVGFSAALNLKSEDDRAYIRWAEARALKQPAAFLMPLAMRAFKEDPAKALNWFYFGRLRLLIDMARCEIGDAPGGLFLIMRAVEETVPEIERHPGRAAAWRWALEHDARHPEPVLAGQDCLILENFGRAMQGAIRGKKPGEIQLLDKAALKPKSEWPAARDKVRAEFERTMRVLVGEPEAPSAMGPQAKQVPEPSAPTHQDKPAKPDAGHDPAAEARRLETQRYPDPPAPTSRHGQPGKFGPVPTGEPGDPFHIAEVRGNGWRLLDAGPGLINKGWPYYWLDTRRVFFAAYNGPYRATPEEREKHKFRSWYFIWNTETGEIRRYSDLPVATSGPWYCTTGAQLKVKTGAIHDEKQIPTHIRWLFGPIGQGREVVEPLNDENSPRGAMRRWAVSDCRYVATPNQLRGHKWEPLRDGDGYLDFGLISSFPSFLDAQKMPPDEQPKLRLRRFGPDEDIELRIGVLQVTGGCVRYFPFRDAYFLYDCLPIEDDTRGTRYHWTKFNCLPAWWLWRDGRTEEMCIPSGPWNSGASFWVVPTARGLFVATVRDGGVAKSRYAGGYLVRNNHVQKVVSGVIPGATDDVVNVSTDGCRVALSIAPNFAALSNYSLGPITVRVLDVCVDGGNTSKTGKGG